MTELLSRIFVKNHTDVASPVVRRAYGTLVSVVGIIVNLFLFAGKFIVGALFHSVAVTADAVNNLSDAGSSIISFISFKISAKPADRDHPFGHARIEYVASMIVSFFVLLIGFELLKESVGKIFEPVTPDKSLATVIVLVLSILGKLWLGFFNRKVGKRIDSSVMRATATDCFSDSLSTGAVLISTLILFFFNLNVDAYMGIIVAVLILIAGIKILNETKNSILGEAPSKETVDGIRYIVSQYEGALGIHDLVVHSYGPGRTIASLHVEVDGSGDIFAAHDMIDNIEKRISTDMGIQCTIHLDPIVVDDEKINALRAEAEAAAVAVDERIKIHDFRFVEGVTHSNLIFDVAVPFEVKLSDSEIVGRISGSIAEKLPNHFCVITVDRE